jgi:coenzyme PQQ precursor peptide PqqA
MFWKAPKILELPVGMEINMYACATSSSRNARQRHFVLAIAGL